MKRRDFIKTVGVAGVAIASGDLIADLLAQSPKGQVLQSKFKGLGGHRARAGEARGLQLRRRAIHDDGRHPGRDGQLQRAR